MYRTPLSRGRQAAPGVPTLALPDSVGAAGETLYPVVLDPGHVPNGEVDVVRLRRRLEPPFPRSQPLERLAQVAQVLFQGHADDVFEVQLSSTMAAEAR